MTFGQRMLESEHWDERIRLMQWWADNLHQSLKGPVSAPLLKAIIAEASRVTGMVTPKGTIRRLNSPV